MEFFNSLVHWIVGAIFGLAAWIALSAGSVTPQVVQQSPSPTSTQPAATTTVAIKPAATSTLQTATTTKKVIATSKIKAATTTSQTTSVSTPPAAPAAAVNITNEMIADTNAKARAAVVNILCTFRTSNSSSYISGSGIMIDSRGVIITNAHIAEYFLLQDQTGSTWTSCSIRTGSPATAAYKARLLYIPTSWVSQNASQILSNDAIGTGERDYAFLYVTGPTQFAPTPPSSFASLTFSTLARKLNEPVLLAGYPAGFLDATGVQRTLYPTSAVSKIQSVWTFESASNIDLISLGGTAVAQGGSSGGAVVDLADNQVIGVIANEADAATTAGRDLRAITFGHVDRSLSADGQGGIYSLLAGDLNQKSKDFTATTVPALAQKLLDVINKSFSN
jgi:hypothetical protein